MKSTGSSPLRVVGINFDHMHMATLLRQAAAHPGAEVVGVCDEAPRRMTSIVDELSLPAAAVFSDFRTCLETTKPDLVMLCPATATHGDWVEAIAPFTTHVLVEKPFAASLADADRMIAAMNETGKLFVVNWPLAFYPQHLTAKRLIDEGAVGRVIEIHHYGGNRGPHRRPELAGSWWSDPDLGGGSLLDYLGYGTTLATWFRSGERPTEVTAMVYRPEDGAVDEQAIAVARYSRGLSSFQSRWGTFTDPWEHQPQPRTGFVIVGTAGTIGSFDFAPGVRLQTSATPEGEEIPLDAAPQHLRDPISNVVHTLETGEPVHEPLRPDIGRIGQQIVDTAVRSAAEGRAVALLG